MSLDLDKIYIMTRATSGANLEVCRKEMLQLCAVQQVDVRLEFNGRVYEVQYAHLCGAMKELK